jgi:serine O-acetyltransferase
VRRTPLAGRVLLASARSRFRFAHRFACVVLGSDFSCRTFGSDLYLPHPYGLVVHAGARIGNGCRIYQNVTIGERAGFNGVPRIGNDVFIGAGAVIIGPVNIGDGAKIGANAVVLTDVPPGFTAVGVPAQILDRQHGRYEHDREARSS